MPCVQNVSILWPRIFLTYRVLDLGQQSRKLPHITGPGMSENHILCIRRNFLTSLGGILLTQGKRERITQQQQIPLSLP